MASIDDNIDDIKDSLKVATHSISEVVQERIFKPMYFYFIIAWVIINWKFVYVLLFAEEELMIKQKSILKAEYLDNIYQWSSNSEIACSLLSLLIAPALSSLFIITLLSSVSIWFFKQNQKQKERTKTIQKLIKKEESYYYDIEITRIIKERKKIIKDKLDKDKSDEEIEIIEYTENEEFNKYINDNTPEQILVFETNISASMALHTDQGAYKSKLNAFINDKRVVIDALKTISPSILETTIAESLYDFQEYFTDEESLEILDFIYKIKDGIDLENETIKEFLSYLNENLQEDIPNELKTKIDELLNI